MARLVRSFLLLAALGAAPVAATAAAPAACAAAGTAGAHSDIDYASINQQLQQPEATLVRHRLLYALAQTQASLDMTTAATANLKKLPATSPQAPEALLLLAEMEVKGGRNKAAVRWLRQLADLYPNEPITIQALWRAAELNHPSSRQALALWQQAARQADQALALAQDWHARSQQPGFIDAVAGDKLSPELWRLARSTFMDPAFASADTAQAEARRQLQCMAAGQGGALRRMDSGSLVADLNSRVGNSRSKMHALLQQRLEAAVQDWQNLSAEAHFRLADAQEPRVFPGLRPAD